jgi:hypothetical protein
MGRFRSPLLADHYSRGQPETTNNFGCHRSPFFYTGIDADWLGKARGRISASFIEPFLRRCTYKEIYPEILVKIPKKYRKNLKKCGIASFQPMGHVHHVAKNFIKWLACKKNNEFAV